MRFLELKRARARGRVSAYTLRIAAILETTEDAWSNVGMDFMERMARHAADNPKKEDNSPEGKGSVIPFPSATREIVPRMASGANCGET